MDTASRKPSIGAMVLALLMLFFGGLMSGFGYFHVSEWRAEQALLIACGVAWILTGPAVFGSALWLAGGIARPKSAGATDWRDRHGSVWHGFGGGCGYGCDAVHWAGLTARKTDLRWRSSPDRVAGVEKRKVMRNLR